MRTNFRNFAYECYVNILDTATLFGNQGGRFSDKKIGTGITPIGFTRREVLPNIAMPLATDFGLRFVWVILFISSLSFLGLGVQPPMSDWGSMVKENLSGLVYGSVAPLMPALAIATLTISVNMIVDDISAATGGKLAKRMIS